MFGKVPEWLNGTLSKSVVDIFLPRVRIPPFPPDLTDSYYVWLLYFAITLNLLHD
jgi:hypothetical protein